MNFVNGGLMTSSVESEHTQSVVRSIGLYDGYYNYYRHSAVVDLKFEIKGVIFHSEQLNYNLFSWPRDPLFLHLCRILRKE